MGKGSVIAVIDIAHHCRQHFPLFRWKSIVRFHQRHIKLHRATQHLRREAHHFDDVRYAPRAFDGSIVKCFQWPFCGAGVDLSDVCHCAFAGFDFSGIDGGEELVEYQAIKEISKFIS